MSNRTVFKRLHAIVDQSEIEIGGSFEGLVQSHIQALEGVSLEEIQHAWQLASNIRFAHFMEDGVEYGDAVNSMKSRNDIRSFLEELERRIGAI